MPLSPSMYVIAERVEAVFVKAGSYVMRPKSSSSTLIWRKSMARTVPSVISISYDCPVRLSVTDRVSRPSRATSPAAGCVSVLIASPGWGPRGPESTALPSPPRSPGRVLNGASTPNRYPSRAGATRRVVLGGDDGRGHRGQGEDGADRHHAARGAAAAREVGAAQAQEGHHDRPQRQRAAGD